MLAAMKYLSGETFADTFTSDARIKHILGQIPEEKREEFLDEAAKILRYVADQSTTKETNERR